jgi:hypothetical protein
MNNFRRDLIGYPYFLPFLSFSSFFLKIISNKILVLARHKGVNFRLRGLFCELVDI